MSNATLRDHDAQHTNALARFDETIAAYRERALASDNDVAALRKRVAALEVKER